MNNLKHWLSKNSVLLGVSAMVFAAGNTASGAQLDLVNEPLFLNSSAPPLNLLVLGRDHKLYYEAYNDHSDLNEDGQLDVGYKGYAGTGAGIKYFGYFDSGKCYTYSDSDGRFNPSRLTADKKCPGTEWSGDFLNYLTTARIDALRKVLYGGRRTTDTNDGVTVLSRSHIPQDAHSWGKEYTSVAVDKYDIADYTPYNAPASGKRHLFANTTLLKTGSGEPRLRVALNQPYRIWQWVSIERPVADAKAENGGSGPDISSIADLYVRVRVCDSSMLEANCQQYPNGKYKPIGLLQEFGENDSMLFGLLTGSHQKNTSGGVLRREVNSITQEINPADGTFRNGVYVDGTLTSNKGIITTLNRLRTTGFLSSANYQYSCGWGAAARPITQGECQMWGNPLAEMMYEGLRYFAGKGAATSDFSISYGAGEESELSGSGLPVADWDNPYTKRATCSKPFETVVSDINPSYDTDQLPGTAFATFSGDTLGGMNVSALGQTIWDQEFGTSATKKIFIGEVGATANGAPTPKDASSFGNIRGLSPEEPTKMGGYYSASVAYHGRNTDLNSKSGDQKVSTFAVALASPLPKIEIPVGGKKITLVPFAKSVAGSGISASATFQPTDQIVDFYVDTLTTTSGKFRVNFEDVEQGADHDMDAIVVYEYQVNADNTVTIKLTSEYAAGGITQHMGYVISGTTKDGIYLDVLDQRTGDVANDVDYFLDTPAAFTGTPPAPSSGAGTWKDNAALPFTAQRTFTPGATAGATILPDPLWYAAKWGGFKDGNKNDKPDVKSEWDANSDGVPDNYFLVTNALTLGDQLRSAFNEILARVASASSATVNSGSVNSSSRIYQATFSSGEWTGHLLAYRVKADGSLEATSAWDAADSLPTTRSIFTTATDGTRIPFAWNDVKNDSVLKAQLGATDAAAQAMLEYVRGSETNEASNGGAYRTRPVKLGDIVNSAPMFVGKPAFFYPDNFETSKYSQFRSDNANRKQVIYVGANDGMVHAFDVTTSSSTDVDGKITVTDVGKGKELFAYIPSPVIRNLKHLAEVGYNHRFFVDGSPNMGDVHIKGGWHTVVVGGLNKGGQGIYALDVTKPESFSASDVLWEFTDRGAKGDPDLGYTFGQPAIVKLQNGKWGAVFGNGYNSSETTDGSAGSGEAVLFVVDMSDGTLIKKISTKVGDAATPNGLNTPTVVDDDGDSIADFVYAGDLRGNLWKFDLRSTSSSSWGSAYSAAGNPKPLYVALDAAGNRQPITSRPEVARGPNGAGMIVLFGTGKFIESKDKIVETDVSAQRVQSFYGIVDTNTMSDSDTLEGRPTSLRKQEIIAEPKISTPKGDVSVRVTSDHPAGTRGWYIDLLSTTTPQYRGERVVSNPIFRNDRVVFTTLIPASDPCSFGGDSWIMEFDALTGSRLGSSPFDVNRDGVIDQNDAVTVTVGDTSITVYGSGVISDVGIVPEPGILTDRANPREFKYTAGSSGNIQTTIESTPPNERGRQSWRPVR